MAEIKEECLQHEVLVKRPSKKNSHILQNGTTTLENSLTISYEHTPYHPAIPHLGIDLREMKNDALIKTYT